MTNYQLATKQHAKPADSGFLKRRLGRGLLKNIVWLWIICIVLLAGIINPFFLTIPNVQNILVQATVLGLIGLAAAFPLLVGEIDLSIAANMGLSSCVGALTIIPLGLPTGVGILLGVVFGGMIGAFNGWCVTRLRMVSLIESLGMMIFLQGTLLAVTQGKTITDMTDSYTWIGQARLLGWPVMPIALLVCFMMMAIMLRKTILGRSLYATGGNAAAAYVAGIRVNNIKLIAFALSGVVAGIAGYFLAAWQMAIASDQGAGFLMYAIAAPIIGGVSVFGGRGNVMGILGGVLLLTVIRVGLAIVNVPSFYVEMIGGVLIFIAVAVDAIRVNLGIQS